MRITGGQLKGRKLSVPKSGVRPTQERVREALFSSIAAAIPDACVLDLFAGTGAFGLEAWSRGAALVRWVESDPRAFRMLRQSVRELCGPDVARGCLQIDVFRLLRHPGGNAPFALPGGDNAALFDFILADPPYDRHDPAFDLDGFLTGLAVTGWLKPTGVLVFEQRSNQEAREHPQWSVLRERTYGEARIVYYQAKTDNE